MMLAASVDVNPMIGMQKARKTGQQKPDTKNRYEKRTRKKAGPKRARLEVLAT
jgi:hypothetical protein